MNFAYEDLISGEPIPVYEIGHIRSPFLYEIKPHKGIGYWLYNLYVNIMRWEKDDVIRFTKMITNKNLNLLAEKDKVGVFDALTIVSQTRMLLQDAITFFMTEDLRWVENKRYFEVLNRENGEVIGVIDRKNFDEVRDMILQVNYVDTNNPKTKPIFSSEKAKQSWEKVQEYLKQTKNNEKNDHSMDIGNVISKLSCAGVGYNLLNIYNLTVYQLYDQFSQYAYLRKIDLGDMIFSNHGGDNFNAMAWLEPIKKYEKEN